MHIGVAQRGGFNIGVDQSDAAASGSSVKTINGLAKASVKTVNDLDIASVKTVDGLA